MAKWEACKSPSQYNVDAVIRHQWKGYQSTVLTFQLPNLGGAAEEADFLSQSCQSIKQTE